MINLIKLSQHDNSYNIPSTLNNSNMQMYYTSASSNKSAKSHAYGLASSIQILHTQRWGFNDLKRRQTDLCDFVNAPCTGNIGSGNTSTTIPLMKLISFIPLPLHSH